MVEKREHKRIKYVRQIVVEDPNGDDLSLNVFDYSMGGMGLICEDPFEIGTLLRLHSLITLEGDERELDLEAEVVHVQNTGNEYTVGISFL